MTHKRNLLAAAICGILVLSSCATGGVQNQHDDEDKKPVTGKPNGKITVWSWDEAAHAMKRLAKNYENSHPGTTVKVVDIGYDNAYDKISVGLKGKTGLPDLVTIETDVLPSYLDKFPQGFRNLTPLMKNGLKQHFDSSKVDAGTKKQKQYALPWDSGTVALYYRRDYLKQSHIDPKSLTTWEATMKAGEKIKKETGHTLISSDIAKGGGLLTLMQQQGLGIFNSDGQITVNKAKAVKALTLLKRMHDKGLLANVKGWDGRVRATKAGKSALDPTAVWWTGTLQDDVKSLKSKFGVVPLPAFSKGGNRTSNDGGSNLVIPSQADNPATAASFSKWLLAKKQQQTSMMKHEGLFPSYLPALKTDYFQQHSPYFDDQKAYKLFADLTPKIKSVNYTSDFSEAEDIVNNKVTKSVLNGASPKESLDSAAKQISNATGRKIAK